MPEQGRIGDRLVARGLLTRPVAETIAVETVLASTRFASVAVSSGRVPEREVLKVLSAQLGLPAVDLERVAVPRSTLDKVPPSVARQHLLLPLHLDGENLLLAMTNPLDGKVIDEVSFATGLKVRPYLALHLRVTEALARAYGSRQPLYEGPQAKGVKPGELPVVSDAPAAPPATPALAQSDGDEFEVEVADEPLIAPSAPLVAPAPTSASASAKVILVVDDEPDIQQLVVGALKGLGHEIVTAARGAEALQLVKTRHPDLIILDAMLPEVHGFEICRKVKASKRFGATPVLMISAIYRGWRLAEDIKTLYGVDSFLEKPFRISELRRQTEALLARAPLKTGDEALSREALAHYDAGAKAFQAGHDDAAFQALRSAESLEPFSAKVQFLLGRVLERQARAFQAIYHYERAIELQPNLFPATKNLALLYQSKGFKNKAVEMWERCLRAAPSPEIHAQVKQHLVSML